MQGREETRRTWRVRVSARERKKSPRVGCTCWVLKTRGLRTRPNVQDLLTSACLVFIYITERPARTHTCSCTLSHTAHTHTHTHTASHGREICRETHKRARDNRRTRDRVFFFASRTPTTFIHGRYLDVRDIHWTLRCERPKKHMAYFTVCSRTRVAAPCTCDTPHARSASKIWGGAIDVS